MTFFLIHNESDVFGHFFKTDLLKSRVFTSDYFIKAYKKGNNLNEPKVTDDFKLLYCRITNPCTNHISEKELKNVKGKTTS